MKTPDNKPLGRIFPSIFLPAGLLCSSVSHAATYVWTGDDNNAWGNSANWDIAGTPDSNDNVIYYDNPFSGNTGFAGLSNGDIGDGQREANSIEFSSNITSEFQINPQGDDGLANDGPDHHLNIKGGGIDVQTTSTITLNVDVEAAVNQSWNVIAGGTLIADEQVRENKITKTGTGTLTLRGGNTNSGFQFGTTNGSAAGTISIESDTALGAGQLGFEAGGTLDLGVGGLTVGNKIFIANRADTSDRTIRLDLAGSADGELTNTFTLHEYTPGSFVAYVGTDDTLTFSGNVITTAAEGPGLTKEGAGTLVLSGTNSYKGTTTVSAGVLKLSGGSAIGDFRDVSVDTNGTLDLNGSSETINRLTGSGTIDTSGGNSTLTVGKNNASFTFDGSLTNTLDALTLKKTGNGVLTLTGASTHIGGSSIAGDDSTTNTVNVQHNNALGTGEFVFERGGILELGVDGLNISNDIAMNNWSDGVRTIKLDLDGARTGEFSGDMSHRHTTFGRVEFNVGADDVLTYSGNITPAGTASGAGIKKVGSGTLALSGANTYKGKTAVTEGTLSLATGYTHGSSSGLYSVVGGTLKIADGVDISTHAMTIGLDGVISPGNSPGTATTGSQTWNNGGTYLWEINDSDGSKGLTGGGTNGWDWLDITGTLELGNLTTGGFTIDIDSLNSLDLAGTADGFDTWTKGSPGDVDYSFIIATASGGINNFDAGDFILDSSGFSNAPSWDWSIQLSGNDLVLEAYAVPEPSSTALLALGGLALVFRRRK
jgi:autotransporter-associated beta strand protein